MRTCDMCESFEEMGIGGRCLMAKTRLEIAGMPAGLDVRVSESTDATNCGDFEPCARYGLLAEYYGVGPDDVTRRAA